MKRNYVERTGPGRPANSGAFFPRTAVWMLVAVLGTGGTQVAQGAQTPRWKFKQGETLRYTMMQETSQGMKANGQDIKTSLNQTVDLHWSVKNVAGDGVAELSQTIDRVRTKIESPGNSFRI